MRNPKRYYATCIAACKLLLDDMKRREAPNAQATVMADNLKFLFKMGTKLPTGKERLAAVYLAYDIAGKYWDATSDTRIASVHGILETLLCTDAFSLDNALLSNAA